MDQGNTGDAGAPTPPPRRQTQLRRRAEGTTVGELMTRSAVSLQPGTRTAEARQMFLDRGISSAPVVDEAFVPIGILSKTDLLRALCDSAGEAASDAQAEVQEIVTPYVLSLPAQAPITVAAALMAYEGVHRLPVVAPSGEVVGMISTLDIVKWIARCTDHVAPEAQAGP